MGQKVHPHGLRLGIIRTWDSRWFTRRGYAGLLLEDFKIRAFLKKKLFQAALSKIDIERQTGKVTVNLFSARPGIIIGKKGSEVEGLRDELKKLTGKEVFVNIREVKNAEVDAQLVAENVAGQLERRVGFRRAMKKSMQTATAMGAKGIKIICSGRLGGAEIARIEKYMEGKVPLHTLRANVEYGSATAFTTYGTCGVKVWIFTEEILDKAKIPVNLYTETRDPRGPRPSGDRGERGGRGGDPRGGGDRGGRGGSGRGGDSRGGSRPARGPRDQNPAPATQAAKAPAAPAGPETAKEGDHASA
ncbi:MAG TPA: 30S ribosomal protein S3 [bacterium]|jgi:small subunit ribosomal protein S3|nr:30S ribosomal protein S3 [bacterium]